MNVPDGITNMGKYMLFHFIVNKNPDYCYSIERAVKDIVKGIILRASVTLWQIFS
jgi:hypothetical protein